jgi:hypothetical protein
MNIWPRAVEAVASGKIDASTAAVVVLQSVSVATMAAVPFAFEKARNWLIKLFCLVFGAALFSVNLFNAIEVAGHVRETVTAGSSGKLATAAALESRLAGLRKSRAEVPQHAFTSPASLSAAESAVKSAEAARDTECRYSSGPRCRDKESAVTATQAALAKVAENRELTERADRIETDIRAAETELANLGPLPTHADATAAKIAAVFGFLGLTEAGVHDNWPTWLAVVVELLALFGPLTWVEALRAPACDIRTEAPVSTSMSTPLPASLPQGHSVAAATPTPDIAAVPQVTAVAPTHATPAKTAKSPISKGAGVAEAREWFKSRTITRAGNLVRVRDTYEAYCIWSNDRGVAPMSLTAFGTLLKGELAVGYVEKSKRGFYTDIALIVDHAPLRLAVVNS